MTRVSVTGVRTLENIGSYLLMRVYDPATLTLGMYVLKRNSKECQKERTWMFTYSREKKETRRPSIMEWINNLNVLLDYLTIWKCEGQTEAT